MRNRITILLLVLVLCAGALIFPASAYADAGKDTTPPTLEVKKDGDMLAVSASDDMSGVEAVYIDENRINSLADGKATVILKDYAGTEKTISVYAVDYAGNRSETKTLDNPYYKEPVSQAPVTETQQPSAQNNSGAAGRSQESTQTPSAPPAQTTTQQETETPETVSSIPEGAFTPEGTGTVLDRATGADGDKQFYTITTEAGNVFYLIVDGKRDSNNVYFLNGVTEADLMALAEKDENVSISSVPTEETCICTDKCEAGHVNTDCPVCRNDLTKCKGKAAEADPSEEHKEPEKEKSGGTGTIIFIVIAVLAVAGIGYYVKIVRPKKGGGFDDDDGFEEEGLDEDFADYGGETYLPEDDIYSDGDGE